jgi:2-polyprenyl-6-methoxyphenol hydroxylase-like FAD-dependent oxidoreductase
VTDVLIVGAGPTGLALAIALTRHGVAVRIIDKDAGIAPYSRALGVQARTLEFYRQLGFDQLAVDAGVPMRAVNFWVAGNRRAHVPIGDIGKGLSPYPYVLDFAQNDHEQMLADQLAKLGVSVERSTELVTFEHDVRHVCAGIRKADGSVEEIDVAFLAGCDGGHSAVRAGLGITLTGATYSQLFYVADVVARGPAANDEVHVDFDTDLLAIFAMRGPGHVRLVGAVRPERAKEGQTFTFDDVDKGVLERMQFKIEKINWFSTYRVHHRVAQRFQEGRVFLLGDASHLHSPVGAQGMNTGIGDAFNLAWKLADMLNRRGTKGRIESYEIERIAFAHRLVKTTDQIFTFATKRSPLTSFARNNLFPPLMQTLTRLQRVRNFLFRTVSQIAIDYKHSPLSRGVAGTIHGGERLPWIEHAMPDGGDNFEPLRSLAWQVHVYGEPAAGVQAACEELNIEHTFFAWKPEMKRPGFERGALYLIRPDGYVALAAGAADSAASLRAYAAEFLTA